MCVQSQVCKTNAQEFAQEYETRLFAKQYEQLKKLKEEKKDG